MTAGLEWACDVCGCVSLLDGDDGHYYCDRCNSQADIVDTARDEEGLYAHQDGGIYSLSHRRSRSSQNMFVEPRSQIYSLSHRRSRSSQNMLVEPSSQVRRTPALDVESFEDMGNSCTYANGGDTLGPTGPTDFGSYPISLSYNDYYSEIRLRYVMGFQILVQLQCKALVEKFNVNPLIVGIVGPIWLRFLASTRIMADGWADEAVLESESQLQGKAADFMPRCEHRNEPHNMLGKRAVTVWHKSLHSSIPLSYSLAISFLVCHLARENVLPTDIVKWTIEGKIPYFSAFLEIEKQLGPPSRACPLSSSCMFRPIQVIPAQKVESLAAFIAQKVGLQLPPVNFHGISSRFLNKLGVPVEEILPQACRIYQWSMPPELYLSANKLRTPTRVCVMAILIVTIRKIFDLNGLGKWELSLSGSGNSSFGVNKTEGDPMSDADTHEDLASHDSGFCRSLVVDEDTKFDAIDLLKILEKKYNELKDNYDYSKDLTSYLQYCKDVVFAGSGSSFIDYEEEKLIEELWSFYQNQQDNEPRSSGIGAGGDSMLKRPKTLNEESESIRLLKQDMEDHRFCYIPPRQRKRRCSYLIYARKRKEGAYVYAAHADYYILLRACAKVAQFEIRALHCAVLDFERRLKHLEERIDCCLHVNTTSDDFSEFCCSEVEEDAEDEYADFS